MFPNRADAVAYATIRGWHTVPHHPSAWFHRHVKLVLWQHRTGFYFFSFDPRDNFAYF